MGRQTEVHHTHPNPEPTDDRGTTLSHRWTRTIRRDLILVVVVLVVNHDESLGQSVVYHVSVTVGHTSRSPRGKSRRVRAQQIAIMRRAGMATRTFSSALAFHES